DAFLNREVMEEIVRRGHTRIPVHAAGDPQNIRGVLLVKHLLLVQLADRLQVGSLPVRPVFCVAASTGLHAMLNTFQVGNGQMAIVTSELGQVIGIITLEDVIEEVLQGQIENEHDTTVETQFYRRLLMKASEADALQPTQHEAREQIETRLRISTLNIEFDNFGESDKSVSRSRIGDA
ncbi:hypothetical protein CYMTET_36010, partial [Cymbomonas tetramitiformis]